MKRNPLGEDAEAITFGWDWWGRFSNPSGVLVLTLSVFVLPLQLVGSPRTALCYMVAIIQLLRPDFACARTDVGDWD